MTPIQTELIYPTEFFYKYAIFPGHIKTEAPGELVDVPAGSQCYLCGRKDFTRAYHRDDAIKEGFTNQDICYVEGIYVCLYCSHTLANNVRKMTLYLVTRDYGLQTDMTDGISLREIIKNPPEPPFLLGLGNFRKHTIFRNRVTLSKGLINAYIINGKAGLDQLITLDQAAVISIADDMQSLAVVLNSTPYGVAMANFGKKKLAILSPDQLKSYKRIKYLYGATTPAGWAALQVISESKPRPKRRKK